MSTNPVEANVVTRAVLGVAVMVGILLGGGVGGSLCNNTFVFTEDLLCASPHGGGYLRREAPRITRCSVIGCYQGYVGERREALREALLIFPARFQVVKHKAVSSKIDASGVGEPIEGHLPSHLSGDCMHQYSGCVQSY
jgi:hypothetical protein